MTLEDSLVKLYGDNLGDAYHDGILEVTLNGSPENAFRIRDSYIQYRVHSTGTYVFSLYDDVIFTVINSL